MFNPVNWPVISNIHFLKPPEFGTESHPSKACDCYQQLILATQGRKLNFSWQCHVSQILHSFVQSQMRHLQTGNDTFLSFQYKD